MDEFFIFLEGDDDERLFQRVIVPVILQKGAYTPTLWKYRCETKKEIAKRLNTLQKMGIDYLFISDLDKAKCITARKNELIDIYEYLDPSRIIIVVKSIEGWYAAGLTKKGCNMVGVSEPDSTDNLSHAKFMKWVGSKFKKESIAKMAILNYFSPNIAKKRNASFNYFYIKHCR